MVVRQNSKNAKRDAKRTREYIIEDFKRFFDVGIEFCE